MNPAFSSTPSAGVEAANPAAGGYINAVVTLNSEQLDDVRLQALTLDLCNAINDAGADGDVSNITARPQTTSSQEGSKGVDPAMVGTIVMTLIGAGGVVVQLVQVLKAYVMRDRRLTVDIQAPSGASIKLDASNLAEKPLHETAELLRKVLGV